MKIKNQAIEKITLFKRPFKAKKDGVYLFVISSFLPEIFKFLLICKLGTEDVTGCEVQGSKHKIKNISGNNWTIYF